MNNEEFLRITKQFLIENADPDRAMKEKAYLYSDLDHYGTDTKVKRDWIRSHKKYINELSKKDTLELVTMFWEQPSHEEHTISLSILDIHKNTLDRSDMKMIENMTSECRGWALLDSLVIPIMPTILEKDPSTYEYLRKWIKDDDFWMRRSALLAQLLFFRYDNGGDRELFFTFAKSQFDESWIKQVYTDKETITRARFFIRKAIGWTLREMSAKQPDIVYQFLKDNKAEMSGLSFREGSRKLPEELRGVKI